MWWSNFLGTASGYGIVSKHVLECLSSRGVPCSTTPNYGWGAQQKMSIGDIQVYPAGHGLRLQECLANARDFGANVLTPLYDIWAIEDYENTANQMEPHFLLCPYTPFDCDRMNPVLERYLRISDYVVSMSDHGVNLCKKAGINDVVRIWHGVDHRVYRPLVGTVENGREITHKELRGRIGYPEDCFLIGMNFMNKGNRKMVPEQLEGVKLFTEANPDIKVKVHMHTIADAKEGWDLPNLVKQMGLENVVHFADPYDAWRSVEPIKLAMLWSASNVQLFASGTEGFGIPAIESMSCGTPVIVSDYAAQTELVKPVAPELVVKPRILQWQQMLARYAIPDPEGICKALETVLNSPEDRYKQRLRDYTVKNFAWDVIGPQWVDFYTKTLPDFVDRKCLDIPDNAWGKSEAKVVELR